MEQKNTPKKIHIFINGMKFDETQGVKSIMKGREFAALVLVPDANAEVTRKNSDVIIGLDEDVEVKNGDHFEVIRKTVEAGVGPASKPLHIQRIEKELHQLFERSGIRASIIEVNGVSFVKYESIPTAGTPKGLPGTADVITSITEGYPIAQLDMPALVEGSELFKHVIGASNPQGAVDIDGVRWRFVSYHPYNTGQGGAQWDPAKHGYHEYANQLIMWLKKLV